MHYIRDYANYGSNKNKYGNKHIIYFILKIILIAGLSYWFVSSFFIRSYEVKTASMEPTLEKNDFILVSPFLYGIKIPFFNESFTGIKTPKRGDLVVIIPPYKLEISIFQNALEPLINFITLQKFNLNKDPQGNDLNIYSIKRIIGLPGDTVKVENFEAYIKPAGQDKFVNEFNLISVNYKILLENNADSWENTLPVSGNVFETVLKENEYFLLGDNRPFSNDSRCWGPVLFEDFIGMVIFRYWPFNKFSEI
jgi:signal peptidase I